MSVIQLKTTTKALFSEARCLDFFSIRWTETESEGRKAGSKKRHIEAWKILHRWIYKSIAIFLEFCLCATRGIAVSLLRPVISSNVKIDVVALNWVADVRKQIAAALKWLYKYFTSCLTVFVENSTFRVIKLLHHWETPVQMVCLYNTSNLTSKSLIFCFNQK